MSIILLDPSDNAFVTFDWADVLPAGVTINSASHTVDAPLVKGTETSTASTSMVKVSGAVHGAMYAIAGQATLSNGEVINRQFPVRGWNS